MHNDRLAWWEKLALSLALLAQSYVVGLWYYSSIRGPHWFADLIVAVGAGLALDLIVVTTAMGRRAGRSSGWSWLTALGAFGCSALIALDRYGWEWRSGLHIAFPLVVFLYSQHLATPRKTALETLQERSRSLETSDAGTDAADAPSATGQALLDELLALPLATAQPTASEPSTGQAVTSAPLVPMPGLNDRGIYVVGNTLTGSVYVGSTRRTFRERFWSHRSRLRAGIHNNPKLQVDWSAQREEDFTFSALEIVEDLNDLEPTEAQWINHYRTILGDDKVYNIVVPIRDIKPQSILRGYHCPHCNSELSSKQAVGAAVKNGYCLACKAERLAAV